MLKIKQTKQFKKSLKRITKQGKNIDKMLEVIERKELPSFLKDHELRGRKWNGIRELHIEPDWLLAYQMIDD